MNRSLGAKRWVLAAFSLIWGGALCEEVHFGLGGAVAERAKTVLSAQSGETWVRVLSPQSGTYISNVVSVTSETGDGVFQVAYETDGRVMALLTAPPFAWAWDTRTLPDGPRRLTVRAFGANGSLAETHTEITLDNTTPAVSLPSSMPLITATQSVVVTADASDAIGIARVVFQRDGKDFCAAASSPYACAWAVTETDNGPHLVTATAFDLAGNSKISNSLSLEVAINPDLIPPSAPKDLAASGGEQVVALAWTAATDTGGSGLARHRVDLSLVSTFATFLPGWQDRDVGLAVSTSASGLAPSTRYYGRVRAQDAAGNLSPYSATASTITRADTTPPSVSLSLPAPGAVYTTPQTVPVTAIAADNIGISKVQFFLDGILFSTDTAFPYATGWPITPLDNGAHTWSAKAFDAKDNSSSSGSVPVTVDIFNTTPYDFIATAPDAAWHNKDGGVPWNTNDTRGSCILSTVTLEDGTSSPILFTHPQYLSGGFMHGAYTVTVPDASLRPRLVATFGLSAVAQSSDGVTFAFKTFYEGQWHTLASLRKSYTGQLASFDVDISSWASKTLTLFLCADAGLSYSSDHALWKEAKITTSPSNRLPLGSLDSVNLTNHAVTGWATDEDAPGQPLSVEFYIDGVYQGQTLASSYRSDQGANIGFNWTIPAAYRAGEHILIAYALDAAGGLKQQVEFSPSTYDYETGLVLGPIMEIYGPEKMPIFMDGSMPTMKAPGKPGLLTIEQKEFNVYYKFEGPVSDPFQTLVWTKLREELIDNNGLLSQYGIADHWMMNIYKAAPDLWISFTHLEKWYTPVKIKDTQDYSIGLGVSTNQGESWTFCGEILQPFEKTKNIGGVPVLMAGEYFYVYFNEFPTTTSRSNGVARAKIAAVVDAARRGTVTPWMKYNNGSWDQDGMTGIGSSISTGESHSDAAFCSYTNKFLFLLKSANLTGTLDLLESTDGINWTTLAAIEDGSTDNMTVYSIFASTKDDASDDNLAMGNEFFVIWPRKDELARQENDHLMRRRIAFTKK